MNKVRRKDIRLRIGNGLVIIDFEHGGVTEHHLRVENRVVETYPTERVVAAFMVIKDDH